VMLYCTTCLKPRRAGIKTLSDGSRTRMCKKCGQAFETAATK
jgi:hypothetical protein